MPLLIVLPPSETKRLGGTNEPTALAHGRALDPTRAAVREALVDLSGDPAAAAKALKLGPKSRGEVSLNLELNVSGTLPAIQRYTGVLYDALGYDTLGAEAQAWVGAHVSIQSALFGLIGAHDTIPAYRLSASTRLPQLERPLKRLWRDAHEHLNWPTGRVILDLRSQTYADLAPVPGALTLHVAQRGAEGELRALNHFNKAAKGDLVRRLAASHAEITSPGSLLRWAGAEGLDLTGDPSGAQLTLVTNLGAPAQTAAR